MMDFMVLGLSPSCTRDEAKAAFRKKALDTHPDHGGDPERFKAMKAAYDRVLAAIEERERPLAPSMTGMFVPGSLYVYAYDSRTSTTTGGWSW